MRRTMPYDRGLLMIVLALLGFGLVMVFSASTVISKELYGTQTRIFARQLVYVFLGLLALMLAMRIDYHSYQRRNLVYGLLAVTVVLLLAVWLVPEAKGARRWIRLGPLNFQPSELAKLAVIFFTSYSLVTRKEEFHTLSKGLLPYLGVLGLIVGLVLLEPDLGTAACIAVTAGVLLYLGGLKYRYVLGLLLVAIPSFYMLIVRVPYRYKRFMAFLDPQQDPFGFGYQIRQSLIALGSGGWKGMGYVEGKQKLFFLPEPHTDFIFAVVGEELGLLGCAGLLLLFALLFWRAVRVALRADTLFGNFLGLGIACMIVLQAFLNMTVVTSLLPTKGMPLPFISVGGSSMLVMLIGVGVLLNISQHGCADRNHPVSSET